MLWQFRGWSVALRAHHLLRSYDREAWFTSFDGLQNFLAVCDANKKVWKNEGVMNLVSA